MVRIYENGNNNNSNNDDYSKQYGDFLFAMPIASCGLKLDIESVRVAVGSRLG